MATFLDQNVGVFGAIRDVAPVQHDLGAVPAGAFDLGEGGLSRHDDRRWNPEPVRVVGDALRVISRRHRDHPARAFVGAQFGELHRRAPVLERAGNLLVLKLQISRDPVTLVEPEGPRYGGSHGAVFKDLGGGPDVVEGGC
jgi:hypothetical protein